MYEYLRNITSQLLVNENKLTITESLEIGECPDIFLMDYFFMRFIRNSFSDFVTLVFRSLSKVAFFEGQTEQFEVTHELPLEFCDWYTSVYPIEKGKTMFFQRKQETMLVKFFGTFTVKDTKLYVTIPDYIMYSFVRLLFYQYLYSFNYKNILTSFRTVMPEFTEEIENTHKSFQNLIEKDLRREYIVKTWYYNKITRYTDLQESFDNLEKEIKRTSLSEKQFSFENLILFNSLKDSVKTLELLFSFFYVNFFLYSLVKDGPQNFFDNFYQNYGFWSPSCYSFQKVMQLNANIIFSRELGYSLQNKSDFGKWIFSNTEKDFIFSWYHNFFYRQNPYTKDQSYLEVVKKNYSDLVGVIICEETLEYRGRYWNESPTQRFFFEELQPMEHHIEHYYPGHLDLLSKFVSKGDIVLGNFVDLNDPNLKIKPSGWDETISRVGFIFKNIMLHRFYGSVNAHVLTTDLELSQAFLEAVSEDKF